MRVDFDTTLRCAVCGARPEAQWIGVETLGICSPCAVRVLPALIVDAALGDAHRDDAYGRADQLLAELAGPFWKAVAARFSLEAHERHRKDSPPSSPRPPSRTATTP